MQELSYQISFNTPAFLGNVDQQAQWRTPPIKALIRQWWRVVVAQDTALDVAALRRAEARLFGTASDNGALRSQQSQLRIRLDNWADGMMRQWPGDEPREGHPEVGRVGTELYLGYGPLDYDKATRQAKLNTSRSSGVQRTAIDGKSRAGLRLRLPAVATAELQAALQLVQWFGTLGSRSRNAWGSLHLDARDGAALQPLSVAALNPWLRPWRQCLKLDWPHAIGCDDRGPLVWRTPERATWREVMRDLARIKIAFRTQAAPFPDERPGALRSRHLIAYPVTNHDVQLPGWGRNGRLPNQLRFKLQRTGSNRLRGVIVHLPCHLPPPLAAGVQGRLPDELSLWQDVHRVLDEQRDLLSRLD
jgi:CRISPR-associated protein Cmr1